MIVIHINMMKHSMMTFAIAFTAIFGFSQDVDPETIYPFTYGGRQYEVVKELKSWVEAAAYAAKRGGYLAEINDGDEQQAVYNAIVNGAEAPSDYTSVANGGGIAYIWIGATDRHNEGVWMWDGNNDGRGTHFWTGEGANGAGNGTPADNAYHNWGGTAAGNPQEPDNYANAQHAAAIGLTGWPKGSSRLGNAGEWNDITETATLWFVVEYDL